GNHLVGDVTGDGNLDVVISETALASPDFEAATHTIRVYPGNGDGTFGAEQAIASEGGETSLQQIADVNGDGRFDVIVTDSADGSIAGYYPQQAAGTLGGRVGLPLDFALLNALRVADINGDDLPDLVTSTFSSSFRPSVSWRAGLGAGDFGPAINIASYDSYRSYNDVQVVDLDGDSDLDVIRIGDLLDDETGPVAVYLNQTGENPMLLVPPASGRYLAGDFLELGVHFGFPIEVTGTPRLALEVGSEVVYADYVSGSGNSTLTFHFEVTATDVDLDGVQLASNLIDLNGGALTAPLGGDAVLEFPSLQFDGVTVNGAGPLVQMVSRLDDTPTTEGTVRFAVQFAEDVTDVDVSDFAARMTEGDLAGATVDSVTGSGSLYEVTVSTGTGSGALGLSVLEAATIHDLDGDVLGKGYAGGEVYTVRQQPIGDIDTYYVDGHADFRPVYTNGEFSYVWHDGQTAISSDEIITYLDSTAIVNRGSSSDFDFIGVDAGQPFYLSNASGNIATVPFLGLSTVGVGFDTFADVLGYGRGHLTFQMVGMRSSSGGDFSFYSTLSSGPEVSMATSDGIDSNDQITLPVELHGHFNSAFSKPGTYEIDIVISGYLDNNGNGVYDPIVDEYTESGVQTMVFHVDTLGAMADTFTTFEGETLDGDVSLNDDWHESMGDYTASIETDVANGALTLNTDGSFTYEPNEGFEGQDSFTYRVTNERGAFTIATATIGVTANRLVPFALPEYHGGEFSTGSYGQVTGDFNSDGNVDLIVAGTGENALTYMQGNGDGTFQPEHLLNADSGVRSQGVTGVDYDGDGDTDVLAYEFNDATQSEGANEGTITLYRNDGDANFTREVVFDGLIQGYWIDAGDLNGDGLVDVAYGAYRYDFDTRTIIAEKAVLLQQNDGSLDDKTVLTDEYYGELVIEDVDGDGNLDIVSTGNVFDSSTFTSTAYLQIFAGNGDGTFNAPQDVSSNAAPNIHQVIDLNGDGLKDLLVEDRGADSHVGYYPQQADGSFGERVTLTPGYLYSQVNVAADINVDDLPDIVSYGYAGGYKVIWSPNLGGGVFGDSILLSSNMSNGGLHIADVDNDTYPDIINAGSVSATRPAPISVFINKTDEDPMVLVPPAARTRIDGDPIDLQVYFGFPIEVTGTPRIALQVGENTVYADYVSGSGTPFLDFRYTVAETDIDLDGVQLVSNLIDLNGGTLTDPMGGDAVLEFPNIVFDGVTVNAVGALVRGITRLDTTPTDVDSVRFEV
ncbi:MAG: FG-GAP-like repeat-containing protein, partial [Rhodopirellula sp. JB053]